MMLLLLGGSSNIKTAIPFHLNMFKMLKLSISCFQVKHGSSAYSSEAGLHNVGLQARRSLTNVVLVNTANGSVAQHRRMAGW